MKTRSASQPPAPTGGSSNGTAKPSEPLARAGQAKRFAGEVARAEARPLPAGSGASRGKTIEARPDRLPSGKTTAQPTSNPGRISTPHATLRREADEDDMPLGAGGMLIGERPVTGNTATSGAQQANGAEFPGDRAQIERMAAAIAEIAASAVKAAYVVELPPGLIATAAMIARDASGALVVRIMGLDPSIAAHAGERFRADLAQALSRRRLRVSRVELDGAGPLPKTGPPKRV